MTSIENQKKLAKLILKVMAMYGENNKAKIEMVPELALSFLETQYRHFFERDIEWMEKIILKGIMGGYGEDKFFSFQLITKWFYKGLQDSSIK